MGPLTTIGDEHRSLAAVVHGLEFLVRETPRGEGTSAARPASCDRWIRQGVPREAAPSEGSAYLFPRLRVRTSEFDGTLAELERQHAEGHRVIDELEGALARYEAGEAGGFGVFAAAVEHFAEAQMQHMRLEQSDPARGAPIPDGGRLGRDRQGIRQDGDPRFAVDNDEEFGRCSRGSSISFRRRSSAGLSGVELDHHARKVGCRVR